MRALLVVSILLFAPFAVRPCVAATPSVAMQSVASLRADQRTTLLRSGDRVIAHQPDVDHGRVLNVLGGAAGRTLTVGLGPVGVDAQGKPNFEVKAVADLPGGEVLLYVMPLGRGDVDGLWRWRPGNEPAKRVLAGRDIGDATGLGTLVQLAEVQLATAGGDVWVMLRLPDQSAYCRLDARRLDRVARVAWAFSTVVDGDNAPLPVERQDVWTGRADGSLTLFRPSRGEAWRVNANGRATSLTATDTAEVLPQDQRPQSTAPPLEIISGGSSSGSQTQTQVLRFFPSPPRLSATVAGVRYPAFVIESGKEQTLLGRDSIGVRPGFPVHGLRLSAWCVDAAGTVMAYDAMSGEVFRLNPAGP